MNRKILVVLITKDVVESECMSALLAQQYPELDILIYVSKPKKYVSVESGMDPKSVGLYNLYINCSENRNKARKLALASDAERFLFLDADIVLPVNAVEKLALYNFDVIGGYYPINGEATRYAAGRYLNENGKKVFHSFFTSQKLPEVQQVNMLGLGCALIHRRVLEKVSFEDGLNRSCLIGTRIIDSVEHPIFCRYGECHAFCEDAEKEGFKLYMDSSVICKHLTPKDHYSNIGKDNG